MTTNENIHAIKIQLEKASNRDTNIQINYEINTSVNFLDVTINNENGHLKTCLYHKTTAEPYILPYTSGHPPHVHRNIPFAALLRAARICFDVHNFNRERIRIDRSLLLNNYPPNFIRKQFDRFFQVNNAIPVLDKWNSQVYHRLHEQLFHQPTRREKQLQAMVQDPIRSPTVLQQKIWDSNKMYPRYVFDGSTSTDFQKQFYKWWRSCYGNTASPLKSITVRLAATTNQTLKVFLIHKKPPKEILTRMEHG
ncbi:unnamed protein product [Rotaria sp. Silwood1]|nr:unnamed protein product [Rotaria sp. Silwood1]CAF1664679.1 unnamed protein product [Rotaria sp. Silwood1]